MHVNPFAACKKLTLSLTPKLNQYSVAESKLQHNFTVMHARTHVRTYAHTYARADTRTHTVGYKIK